MGIKLADKILKTLEIMVLTDTPEKYEGVPFHVVLLTLGDYEEYIDIPLNYWDIKAYKKQWHEGIERLKTFNTSCLVTAVWRRDPDPLIFIWELYKEQNTIFVHNAMITWEFKKYRPALPPFDSNTCYAYINPRKTVTENGEKISEWSIELDALKHARVR